MTTQDKIARRKLSLLELASELSNVSRNFQTSAKRISRENAGQCLR